MTAPDALTGYLALVPEGAPHVNEVAARLALQVPFHRPGRSAKHINCPVMFAVCATDSVAPAATTLRHAHSAAASEVRVYPEGHFDIYLGDAFERAVSDQIDFLTRHTPVNP